MARIFLGLGTNLGDRAQHLKDAVAGLTRRAAVRLVQASDVYETPPWGVLDQPSFYNQCLEVETDLSPHALLKRCLELEQDLGRVRTEKWGPRLIDIDLIAWDGANIATKDLILPHPHATDRPFVLIPLADIAPAFNLDGRSVRDRVLALPDARRSEVRPVV